jgi:hypothetical protein
VKRASAGFALIALAAATLALAQTTPQTPAEPPADNSPQQQAPDQSTAAPSDQSNGASTQSSQTDPMQKCVSQVQASNPGVSEKDIKDYCAKEVNKSSSSPQQ